MAYSASGGAALPHGRGGFARGYGYRGPGIPNVTKSHYPVTGGWRGHVNPNAPWIQKIDQNPYVQQAQLGYTATPQMTNNHPPTGGAGLLGPQQSAPHPAAPAPKPSATQTPPPSPLDSTYFANVANNQFKVNNKINDLNLKEGYATTDLQNALSKIAYNEPRAQLKAEQSANSRGALYSTPFQQQLGDMTKGFLDQQSGLNQNYQRSTMANTAEVAALRAGLPLYEAQQYADAAQRASIAAQKNPALGESSGPLVQAPGPAAKEAAPAPKGKTPTQRLAAALGEARNRAVLQAALSRRPGLPGSLATRAQQVASRRPPAHGGAGHHMTSGAQNLARKLAQQQAARGR